MKMYIPTTLMVAGFCLLAMPPCSAQDAETESVAVEEVDAPSAVNEELRAEIPVRVEKTKAAVAKFLGILHGIKDKETADAAVPQVAPAIKEARECMDSLMELDAAFWDCGDSDGADMLQDAGEEIFTMAGEVNEILNTMGKADPAFYGSEALKDAFAPLRNNMEVTEITEEQTKVSMQHMDEVVATLGEMKALLDSVKDKESADAAATKAETYADRLTESWEKLMMWLQEINAPRTYCVFLLSRYEEKLQVKEEIRERIQALSEMDPPFYGCEALQSALIGDGNEAEEEGEEEEPETEE